MKRDLSQINALAIWLQDYHVGTINRLAGDRYIFTFENEYIEDPKRPILSLSFKGASTELISGTRLFRLRLPPFFSNLLPEGHLRTYLADKLGVRPEREFFLLSELGADLPGAITASVIETNKYLMKPSFVLANRYHDDILRFSLAGIQLKFSAVMESTGGLTIPADGIGGSWIIKLPSHRFTAVPENEYVMLALARAIGINLPKNKLIDIKKIHGLPDHVIEMKGSALAIERFDRSPDGQRIHMEDFAQIFSLYPDDKYKYKSYANIASVLWAEIGKSATEEFLRRIIFSILIGNADMHLKNWSLLYRDGRTPELSPAYDMLSTIPYIINDELALSFGNNRQLNKISQEQLRRFADTAGLSLNPLKLITKETMERTIAAWQQLDEKSILPKKMQHQISQQIETVVNNSILMSTSS